MCLILRAPVYRSLPYQRELTNNEEHECLQHIEEINAFLEVYQSIMQIQKMKDSKLQPGKLQGVIKTLSQVREALTRNSQGQYQADVAFVDRELCEALTMLEDPTGLLRLPSAWKCLYGQQKHIKHYLEPTVHSKIVLRDCIAWKEY